MKFCDFYSFRVINVILSFDREMYFWKANLSDYFCVHKTKYMYITHKTTCLKCCLNYLFLLEMLWLLLTSGHECDPRFWHFKCVWKATQIWTTISVFIHKMQQIKQPFKTLVKRFVSSWNVVTVSHVRSWMCPVVDS